MSPGLQSLQREALQQPDSWPPPEQRGSRVGDGGASPLPWTHTDQQKENRKKTQNPLPVADTGSWGHGVEVGVTEHVRSSGFCERE